MSDAALRVGEAVFSYREAGSGPPLVLLHGIGGSAASFRDQLVGLAAQFRMLAWDAPGYGGSTPLAAAAPDAGAYAAALERWLDALGLDRIHLLGHSLGALIAVRFAAEQPRRVVTLTLSGVARGHGHLPSAERRRRLRARLDALAALGPRGMAERRGPRLLGSEASAAMRERVVATMARVRPEGYAPAAHMLANADIAADLVRLPRTLPVQIIVGADDAITPPAANREIAALCAGAPVHIVPGAGHALYLEKPEAFNRLVGAFVAAHII
ncbi:MAG TPA: alpha/beta fold hydrolase [Stellaceae bacterium]|nr:alpha/beta fold hydrolase [Stellaceae bacterium]